MKPSEIKQLEAWLARCGAEVLAPTNPYEVVRFKARGGTHVVYRNGAGTIKASGFSLEALNSFKRGASLDMGIVRTKGLASGKQKAALLERDGRGCFYCGQEMPNDDITAEHLISRDKGGPNTLENMALAHGACNRRADNLPLAEKIKLRDVMRVEVESGP